MSRERSIFDGVALSLPHKGERVRIHPIAKVVALTGMQPKLEVRDGAEGVVLHVRGLYHRLEDIPDRPYALEFVLRTDEGTERTIVREMSADALRTACTLHEIDSPPTRSLPKRTES